MAKIGQLTTGDNVVTTINLSWVPQFFFLTTVATTNVLKGISIAVGGRVVQQVIGQALITSVMKYMVESLNGTVGFLWKVSSGLIGDQTCQLNLTNSGANTNEVFAYSARKKGVPYLVAMENAPANTPVYISNFTALFFVPTNFDTAEIEFSDGHTERMNAVELNSLFALENQTDANGLLGTCTVIDNKLGNINGVTLYANASGALDIAKLSMVA